MAQPIPLIALGDSITTGSDAAKIPWPHRVRRQLGGTGYMVCQNAVGGTKASQIVTSFSSVRSALSTNYYTGVTTGRILLLMGGINDVNDHNANPTSAAAIFNSLRVIPDAVAADNIAAGGVNLPWLGCLWCYITPARGYSGQDDTEMQITIDTNALIAAYKNPWCKAVDVYSLLKKASSNALADGANGDPDYATKSGSTSSGQDGLHINDAGQEVIATAVVTAIRDMLRWELKSATITGSGTYTPSAAVQNGSLAVELIAPGGGGRTATASASGGGGAGGAYAAGCVNATATTYVCGTGGAGGSSGSADAQWDDGSLILAKVGISGAANIAGAVATAVTSSVSNISHKFAGGSGGAGGSTSNIGGGGGAAGGRTATGTAGTSGASTGAGGAAIAPGGAGGSGVANAVGGDGSAPGGGGAGGSENGTLAGGSGGDGFGRVWWHEYRTGGNRGLQVMLPRGHRWVQ